jgi:hypothetical protein
VTRALYSQSSSLVKPGSRLDKFFERVAPVGRLSFWLDATMSREATWDTAAALTSSMFDSVAGLNVQLGYFRGLNECTASRWFDNAADLKSVMTGIACRSGETHPPAIAPRAQ